MSIVLNGPIQKINRWVKELEGVLESSWGSEEPQLDIGDEYLNRSNESIKLEIKWLPITDQLSISIISLDDLMLDGSRVVVRSWITRDLLDIENLKRSKTRRFEFWAVVDPGSKRAFRLEFLS